MALDRLGKPLHAVLVTHSHPDHYAGLAEIVAGYDIPIVAPQGVIDTITADDASKDQIVGPMFGDDWPTRRVFPDTPIRDGESLTFDGVTFTVIDLGPSESPHDSPWVLGDAEKVVFLGDQIYDHRHCFLADGFYAEWLANIEKLRARFPDDAVFHIGHGGPVGHEMWDWQRRLHRDVPRRGRRRGLVRARIGKGHGRCSDEGIRAVRRAADADGAEHRAHRGKAGLAGAFGLKRSRTMRLNQGSHEAPAASRFRRGTPPPLVGEAPTIECARRGTRGPLCGGRFRQPSCVRHGNSGWRPLSPTCSRRPSQLSTYACADSTPSRSGLLDGLLRCRDRSSEGPIAGPLLTFDAVERA